MLNSRNGKARQRGTDNHNNQRHHRDKSRVAQGLPILHLLNDVREVIQGEDIRVDDQRELDDVGAGFERAEHKIVNRHQHHNGGKHQNKLGKEFTEFLFLTH